jgi:hypothetical protein
MRLKRGEQRGQNERKGRIPGRFTLSRSPHSEQNLAAAIDGTPADAVPASFSRWMFGYGIVVQQYKSNRAREEPKGKEQPAAFGFFLLPFPCDTIAVP